MRPHRTVVTRAADAPSFLSAYRAPAYHHGADTMCCASQTAEQACVRRAWTKARGRNMPTDMLGARTLGHTSPQKSA